ncbi:hypothetical protein P154DRAFT_538192 [Amniculicola lignicola CBS 123094]|uniref:Uncharacterized protein n=1 Tax=Amniculicola lignicola CBS 123094 TaxID=1392246 RepID=A0A6A5W5H9_9PLEO|nr:hypothetical protein P154DRAFT_538192 [Amniculicola lignicola CBS 123094]
MKTALEHQTDSLAAQTSRKPRNIFHCHWYRCNVAHTLRHGQWDTAWYNPWSIRLWDTPDAHSAVLGINAAYDFVAAMAGTTNAGECAFSNVDYVLRGLFCKGLTVSAVRFGWFCSCAELLDRLLGECFGEKTVGKRYFNWYFDRKNVRKEYRMEEEYLFNICQEGGVVRESLSLAGL